MSKKDTGDTAAGVFSNLQKLQQMNKRIGKAPTTFETVKPVVIAMMQQRTMYQLWKDNKEIPYSTLRLHRKVALEYLNPDNTKRKLSASDEAWVIDAAKRYMPA